MHIYFNCRSYSVVTSSIALAISAFPKLAFKELHLAYMASSCNIIVACLMHVGEQLFYLSNNPRWNIPAIYPQRLLGNSMLKVWIPWV